MVVLRHNGLNRVRLTDCLPRLSCLGIEPNVISKMTWYKGQDYYPLYAIGHGCNMFLILR